jgi:hypothetical protein
VNGLDQVQQLLDECDIYLKYTPKEDREYMKSLIKRASQLGYDQAMKWYGIHPPPSLNLEPILLTNEDLTTLSIIEYVEQLKNIFPGGLGIPAEYLKGNKTNE